MSTRTFHVIVQVSVVQETAFGVLLIEQESRKIEAHPDQAALRDAMDAALAVIDETIPDEPFDKGPTHSEETR